MARSTLTNCFLLAGILVSLVLRRRRAQAPLAPPDLSGGEGGWIHRVAPASSPFQGRHPPVRQDPGHPFVGGQNWRIGDVYNPNLKPWAKDWMKKDTDEIDAGKIAFQPRSSCVPSGIPNIFRARNPLLSSRRPRRS